MKLPRSPLPARPLPAALSLLTGAVLCAVLLPAPPATAEPEAAEVEITELDLDTVEADETSQTETEDDETEDDGDRSEGGDRDTDATERAGDEVVAELREESTSDFSTLGISWESVDGADDPEVAFRTRGEDGWSGWQQVEETISGAGRTGTDPIYVGASDGVEVRLSGVEVADPQVALIDPGSAGTPFVASRRAAPQARAAGPTVPRPAMVSRAGWGANESWRCGSNRVNSTIQAAIVHHTAGSNSYTRAESAGVVRGIYAYHTRTLGWCDIGYNFLVDKYGQVFEGRAGGVDRPIMGAHATSWNTDTVGISFMGNYETASAPAVMLEAGAQVLAWKLALHGRDPQGRVTLVGKRIDRIAGHGDVMSTACPGRSVRAKMGWLRDRVSTLMKTPSTGGTTPTTPAPTTAIGKRWQELGGADGVLGWPVAAEQKVAGGTWREFRAHDMFASSRTGAHWTTGSIRSRYRSLGTASSSLGFPTGDERAWPTSTTRSNTFERGAIVWSSSRGAQVVRGGFWDSYRTDSTLRRLVGAPRAAEQRHAQLGVPVQDFENGRVFWTGRTTYLSGGFATHHRGLSGTAQAARGVPTGPETTSRTAKVPTQQLTKATFYRVGGSTREVYGAINAKYRSIGAEASALGLPLSTEKAGPDGSRMSEFQGGVIVWSKAHGAQVVRGGFGSTYRTDSRLRQLLGAPTAAERADTRLGVPVQDFARGRTFWTGLTTSLSGGFASHYRRLNATEQAGRGIPTGPEQRSRTKSVPTQQLTRSTLYWVDGRTREVYGRINDTYRSMGAEASRLGLPLSTEKAGPNGSRVSAFEGGTITWAKGRATVRYR